jgi:2,3-bisphosphoglycerate-independent phosphoglycerate mutase
MLIIMDGWGINPDLSKSAVAAANTPFVDSLESKYTKSNLLTFGEHVGLPFGQMGNSEVGHINLGAGRIVWQDLLLIDKSIEKGDFYKNIELLNSADYAKKNNKPIHLLGLLSDGGVHSHINHLFSLIDFYHQQNVPKVFLHLFTDGRDTDPNNGIKYIENVEQFIEGKNTFIASISGRYYAMDRDKRWDRVKKAYDILIKGKSDVQGIYYDAKSVVLDSYAENITDEFIIPTAIAKENGEPVATIQKDDVVLCFNFRTDRCREITTVLTQQNLEEFGMTTIPLYFITMTIYDESYKDIKVVFGKDTLKNTIGEVLSHHGKTQLRVAETEKYPHVSFFFSGGNEKLYSGEDRMMIPSPKIATYDLAPEMSAFEVTDKTLAYIDKNVPDFVCLNYANADMVGHTGIFSAAVKAVETVDTCVGMLVKKALELDYAIFLTADHGNADYMINEDGSPNTAHSKNLVPLYFIHKNDKRKLANGKLADIAPTILHFMNIPIPEEMDGKILLQ